MEQKNEGILKSKIEELERQFKDLNQFHNSMVDKLKDKIECPVCLDIPRIGPLPVCPNGHFVCTKCVNETCPKCRSEMGSNKSILAGTIIDNIEHKCNINDCDQSFLLSDLVKHELSCPHRTVVCPCPGCDMECPLSELMTHLLCKTSCRRSHAPMVYLGRVKNRTSISFEDDADKLSSDWGLDTYSFKDMDFVVFPKKVDGLYSFAAVMLGTEVECSKFRVEMEVHEYMRKDVDGNKRISYKFCGNPSSIDDDKTKLESLTISDTSMKRVMGKSEDIANNSFTLSFSVFEEEDY